MEAVTSHRSRYIRLEELEVKLHGISHIRNDQISRLLSENYQTEQSRGAVKFQRGCLFVRRELYYRNYDDLMSSDQHYLMVLEDDMVCPVTYLNCGNNGTY